MKNLLSMAVTRFKRRRKEKMIYQLSIPEKVWMVDMKRDAENRAFLMLRNQSKRFH